MTPGCPGGQGVLVPKVLLTSVVGLVACSAPDLPGDLTWESEHFVYKARTAETSACPDIVVALEEHFSVMRQSLGFSWPAGQRVTYYKFLDDRDLRANSECGTAAACTNGSSVEASSSIQSHELVHAYLRPTGFPPWLLLEGAAVALSCQLSLYPRPRLSWQEAYVLDRTGSRSGELYGAGGWLAGFLIRSRPAVSFLDLYRRATQRMSPAAFGALFEEIYGESLDSVWAVATTLERPPIVCPWECSRPPALLDGVTPVSTTGVCGLGPAFTFDLLEASEMIVSLTGDSVFGMGSCGDGSLPPATFWSAQIGTSFGVYPLAAGRYFFGGPGPGANLMLKAHAPETWVRSTCGAQESPPWADLRGGLHLALPRGTWNVPFSWTMAQLVIAYPLSPTSALEASVCPACDSEPGACTTASSDQPFAQTIAGTRFLRAVVGAQSSDSEFAQMTVIAR